MKISFKNGPKNCQLAGPQFPPSHPARTAIIVLNYQHLQDTKRLVKSLEQSSDQDFALYVVDNASEQLTLDDITAAVPVAHVLQTEANLGYAGGNNAALRLIERVNHEFVWILNPDIVLPPDALEKHIAAASAYPEYSIFGSTIEQGALPGRVASSGCFCRMDDGLHVGNLHRGKELHQLPEAPFEADFVSGCSIFLRKAVLSQIGYIPEEYFLYFEETQWLLEAKRKGYACLVQPNIVLKHHQRSHNDGAPALYYMYYYLRGALIFCHYFGVAIDRTIVRLRSEFITSWLEKIAQIAPEEQAFYEALAKRALRDGLSFDTGPVDLPGLERTLRRQIEKQHPSAIPWPSQNAELAVRPTRTALLVLGMHRSGTSALSGMLSILGCGTPATVMPPRTDNERGFFESQKVHDLNRDILDSAGSSWDDWNAIHPGWFSSATAGSFIERAAATVHDEFGGAPVFVLKDPRICRLMPFWKNVLARQNCRPLIVHIHRNPLEVAASLQSRNQIDIHLGLLIWLRHVVDAEHGSRGMARHFTSYTRLMTNWAGVVASLQDDLKIALPRVSARSSQEVEGFLSADMRHFSEPAERVVDNPELSSWVRNAFAILERWAKNGEDPSDYAALDAIRMMMDAASPAFSRLIIAAKDRVADQAETKEKNNWLRGKLERAEAEAADLRNSLSETQIALRQRADDVDEQNRVLRGKLELAEAEASELRKELSETQSALRQHQEEAQAADRTFRRELERAEAEAAELRNALSETQSALRQRQEEAQAADRTWRRDLERAEAEAAELRNALSETQSALRQRQHEADETNSVLRKAQIALKAHAGELTLLTQLLVQKEAALEKKRAELSGLEKALDDLKLAHEAKHRGLEKALAQATRQREVVSAEIGTQMQRAEQLEHEVAALRASTSWKLTAPLRYLVTLYRRS